MANVEVWCMWTVSTNVSLVDMRPIQWIPADSMGSKVKPLEAQLNYYTEMLKSAAIGDVLLHAPCVSWPVNAC
jgi:hypothetical protein